MWFKTEEKNEEDNQDIQTLINKTVKESLTQYQQGNLNTYSSQAKKKKRKFKSRKWVSPTEVAEITGLKDIQWARELIVKGYFGQVRKWGNNRNKVLREVVENTDLSGRGNPIKYKYPNVESPKTNSLSSEGTRTKWVNATEVSEIKGKSTKGKAIQHTRNLMRKGYFGKVIGKGVRHNPLKVLREVVENTEWLGNTQWLEENKGRPNVKYKKPKTNYLSKWIIAREVAELKGMQSSQWGRDKMIKGYFGKTKGEGTRKSPLKVLREVVENTEITKQVIAKVNSSSDRPKVNKKPSTEEYRVVQHMPTWTKTYEEIRKQLMEDPIFLSKVGSNVMSNLRFINKLDSE
jgi:hypothetical protein